jgi:hypothetical protein
MFHFDREINEDLILKYFLSTNCGRKYSSEISITSFNLESPANKLKTHEMPRKSKLTLSPLR